MIRSSVESAKPSRFPYMSAWKRSSAASLIRVDRIVRRVEFQLVTFASISFEFGVEFPSASPSAVSLEIVTRDVRAPAAPQPLTSTRKVPGEAGRENNTEFGH